MQKSKEGREHKPGLRCNNCWKEGHVKAKCQVAFWSRHKESLDILKEQYEYGEKSDENVAKFIYTKAEEQKMASRSLTLQRTFRYGRQRLI